MSGDIQAARAFAAQTDRDLIAAIRAGEVACNDPQGWIAQLETSVADILAGHMDGNFTVWQRMHLFLTGECVPFLAPKMPLPPHPQKTVGHEDREGEAGSNHGEGK